MAQPLVQPDDAKLLVVDQNRIADRIERIFPLPMNAIHLLEQAHVLQRQSKKIRDVGQISDFIRFIFQKRPGAKRQNSERAVFSTQWQRDNFLHGAFRHAAAFLLVFFLCEADNVMVLLKNSFRPAFVG